MCGGALAFVHPPIRDAGCHYPSVFYLYFGIDPDLYFLIFQGQDRPMYPICFIGLWYVNVQEEVFRISCKMCLSLCREQ